MKIALASCSENAWMGDGAVCHLTDAGTDIWIGDSLPVLAGKVAAQAGVDRRVAFCSDRRIWPQVLPLLRESGFTLDDGAPTVCFEPGEAHKQIAQVEEGWRCLSQAGMDRRSAVLNVGGGVVCDMGGFMAATYKRGIPFIQVPTSLLAMVDASVGGKTAVDVGETKNMAGLFVRPAAVYIDPRFLKTLPREEFYAGVAEMIKMQLLVRTDFNVAAAERLFDPVHLPLRAMVEAVQAKKEVVALDFTERGPRRLLNFGHTFGHAFESLCMAQGRPVPHGYAVAWGLVYELYLSVRERGFDAGLFRQIRALLTRYYGRPAYTADDWPALASYLRQDKKNEAGTVRPVVLPAPGDGDFEFAMTLTDAMAVLEHGDTVYSF